MIAFVRFLMLTTAIGFNIVKIEGLLDKIMGCRILSRCAPYIIYPWSQNGVSSRSSPEWILMHMIVGCVNLFISFDRISTFNHVSDPTFERIALNINRIFMGMVLGNFWNFGNLGFIPASILNLIPLAIVYFAYNENPDEKWALEKRWLHFMALWIAPGLEIGKFIVEHML